MNDSNPKYVDGAVISLVENVAHAQQKRSLTQMRITEVENKLAQATEDNRFLSDKARSMAEREEQLKMELTRLNEEYRSLQLLLMTEQDQLHRCRMEEPLLQNHVNQKMNSIKQHSTHWKQKSEQLKSLLFTLRNATATQSLKSKELEIIASTQSAMEQKNKLEEQLDEINREVRKMKEELEEHRRAIQLRSQQSRFNNLAINMDHIEESTSDLLLSAECEKAVWTEEEEGKEVQKAKERKELDELWTKRLSDQQQMLSATKRELEELHLRFEEVQKWYTAKHQVRLQLESSYQLLQQCISSRRCPSCLDIR